MAALRQPAARSARQFSVTEIGQTYLAHCKTMLVEEVDAAEEAITRTHTENSMA